MCTIWWEAVVRHLQDQDYVYDLVGSCSEALARSRLCTIWWEAVVRHLQDQDYVYDLVGSCSEALTRSRLCVRSGGYQQTICWSIIKVREDLWMALYCGKLSSQDGKESCHWSGGCITANERGRRRRVLLDFVGRVLCPCFVKWSHSALEWSCYPGSLACTSCWIMLAQGICHVYMCLVPTWPTEYRQFLLWKTQNSLHVLTVWGLEFR